MIQGRIVITDDDGTLIFYNFRADAILTEDIRLKKDIVNKRLSYIRDIGSVVLRDVTVTGGGFDDPWGEEATE